MDRIAKIIQREINHNPPHQHFHIKSENNLQQIVKRVRDDGRIKRVSWDEHDWDLSLDFKNRISGVVIGGVIHYIYLE